MRAIMLNSGAQLINSQSGGMNKLYITGFACGDNPVAQTQIEAWDIQEPALPLMQGNVVFQSDQTLLSANNTGDPDRIRLSCLIPQDRPQIPISNVVLYAGFQINGSDKQPLSFHASDASVIKLQTTQTSAGYDFIINIMFEIYELSDRFDFSNLQIPTPEFLSLTNENYLPNVTQDGHDQFIVNNHSEYGGLHFVVNSQNRYFGTPLMKLLTDVQAQGGYILDGGIMGDGQ